MAKISSETKKALEGVKSEIIAGGVLIPRSDVDRAWNQANARAASIIDGYIQGTGLFQLATKTKETTNGAKSTN